LARYILDDRNGDSFRSDPGSDIRFLYHERNQSESGGGMTEIIYMLLILIVSIIAGISTGISQGMSMVQPGNRMSIFYGSKDIIPNTDLLGVRSHKWFPNHHTIQTIHRLSLCILGGVVTLIIANLMTLFSFIYIPFGTSLFIWVFFEMGYNKARWNSVFTNRERIDFLDKLNHIPNRLTTIEGMGVVLLLSGKIILGILLLCVGIYHGII
jgi:hypothetical protein